MIFEEKRLSLTDARRSDWNQRLVLQQVQDDSRDVAEDGSRGGYRVGYT
jgi:hypothetical protein